MPDSADHRAEMHRLATDRRRRGLPSWEYKLKVPNFYNESMTFEERRDEAVQVLRSSAWYRSSDLDDIDNLIEIVDNLADAPDAEEFDGWWQEMYDQADNDRAWIELGDWQ